MLGACTSSSSCSSPGEVAVVAAESVLPLDVHQEALVAGSVGQIEKKEKQEKAKLPRQGGPVPEGGSEKQDTARLPRQGGKVGKVGNVEVLVHDHAVGLVRGERVALHDADVLGVELDRHEASLEAMKEILPMVPMYSTEPRFGVGLAPPAERSVPVDVARAVVAHDVEQEIIVGGLPATSTIEFVTGIFSKKSWQVTVASCERRWSSRPGFGMIYKLRLATAQEAKWCIKTLNGSEKAATVMGLESPIFVDSVVDSGWMWQT
jgi:hypothetical protein